MDINEKIKPQVGDVWKEEGPAPDFSAHCWTVAAIDSNQVCLYMINDSGNMDLYGTGLAIEDIVDWSEWELIERDGKPYEPTPQSLEGRIKAEYPEYEVEMLRWSESEILKIYGNRYHIVAQSMKGFAGYVYDDADVDEDFMMCLHPTIYAACGSTTTPIAVLFTKDSKEEA